MSRIETYVHGYSEREAERLYDQADAVRDLLHWDTRYPPGSRVLEAGCGVGAQTITLARNNPEAQFVSIDLSADSLEKAKALIRGHGITNVQWQVADLFQLPFEEESFDHVFVCYVLEHLQDPVGALRALRSGVKRGGTITVIEGDHGSCYYHPECEAARKAWHCLIEAQARLGGNSLIGRQLYPLLRQAGFSDISVSPRMVYVDHSKPNLVDSFVRKTIIAMVEGVKETSFQLDLIDEKTWKQGIEDLNRVADLEDGTFCYTFFKAVGVK